MRVFFSKKEAELDRKEEAMVWNKLKNIKKAKKYTDRDFHTGVEEVEDFKGAKKQNWGKYGHKNTEKMHENHLLQHYNLFYRYRMWLEGMMGAGNTNAMCCGREKLTCAHHAAVSGKCCSCSFICRYDMWCYQSSWKTPLTWLSKREGFLLTWSIT